MDNCTSIFYSKAYARFIEESENVKVKFFKFSEGNNHSCFPCILKNGILSSLRYGGMYTNCNNVSFAESANRSFKIYCEKNNIKTVKIRENPFIQTIKIGKAIKKEPFVCIDLTKNELELNKAISKKHAKNIQNAVNQELTFSEIKDLKYLKVFYRFYKDMLIKKSAVPKRFTYFSNLFLYLKKNIQLVCVKDNGVILAVSIILRSDTAVFMLYGGMSETGYKKHAKHFMIHNLILEYKKRGYKQLVLGTGIKGKDSVYRFREGFTVKDSYIYTYQDRLLRK